jgi:hypothetical protein
MMSSAQSQHIQCQTEILQGERIGIRVESAIRDDDDVEFGVWIVSIKRPGEMSYDLCAQKRKTREAKTYHFGLSAKNVPDPKYNSKI